jgi:hypothetical protein
VKAVSNLLSLSIPAGETRVIFPAVLDPFIALYTLSNADSAIPLGWTNGLARVDNPNGIAPTTTAWVRENWAADASNALSLKSATEFNVPADEHHPLICQSMGGFLDVTVATAFDGLCRVSTIGEAVSGHATGRRMQHRQLNLPATVDMHPDFEPTIHCPYVASGVATCATVAEAVGSTTIIPGSNVRHFRTIIPGRSDWGYCGTLDTVDAPGAGINCTNNGFHARANPQNASGEAIYVFTNTGSSAVQVLARLCKTFAILVEADDATIQVNTLISKLRQQLPSVQAHPPPTTPVAPSHYVSSQSRDELERLQAKKAGVATPMPAAHVPRFTHAPGGATAVDPSLKEAANTSLGRQLLNGVEELGMKAFNSVKGALGDVLEGIGNKAVSWGTEALAGLFA